MKRHRVLIPLLLLCTLVLPAVALAGDRVSNTGGQAVGGTGGTGQASAALPFTGLDLTLIILAGVALMIAGLVIRRRGRSSES
jgi:hypothetical protein